MSAKKRRPPARPSSKRPPRCILPLDRKRIVRELNLRCRAGERGSVSISALRLRAAVLLAGGAALRVSEVCKLNAAQVIDDAATRIKLRSLVYLHPEQSKGRRTGDHQWDSAGTLMIGDDARAALRAYLLEGRRRELWAQWPPGKNEPLFLSVRGNARSTKGRKRLSVRGLQWQWEMFQRRSGTDRPYHFHDLRHTAMTRCAEVSNGNVRVVAAFGRCDVSTALRYVHLTPQAMIDLRNLMAFA